MAHTQRQTVDLSAYPDLVVIYLGMRVGTWRGLGTLLSFGPKISAAGPKTRRLASPRESSLFSFSDSHGNAPILAGLPISGKLGAELAAPTMVEGLSAGFRRHRLLA